MPVQCTTAHSALVVAALSIKRFRLGCMVECNEATERQPKVTVAAEKRWPARVAVGSQTPGTLTNFIAVDPIVIPRHAFGEYRSCRNGGASKMAQPAAKPKL